MSKQDLYSSYRWQEPIKAKVIGYKEQSKEERIESKKKLLKAMVESKVITKEEADKKMKEYIEKLQISY